MKAADEKAILYMLESKAALLKKDARKHRNSTAKIMLLQQIEEIEDAIVRIKSRCYGFCENCFISIPWRELCSRPEKRCCNHCQTQSQRSLSA